MKDKKNHSHADHFLSICHFNDWEAKKLTQKYCTQRARTNFGKVWIFILKWTEHPHLVAAHVQQVGHLKAGLQCGPPSYKLVHKHH